VRGVVISLGQVLLFGGLSPVLPLIVWCSMLLRLRATVFNLCVALQRSPPAPARDIGPWRHAWIVLVLCGIAAHGALLVWGSGQFVVVTQLLGQTVSAVSRVVVLLVYENALLLVLLVVALAVPDAPAWLRDVASMRALHMLDNASRGVPLAHG
jgi:hypothetical protein